MLPGPQFADEVIDALDRAIALDPRCIEAYDMKAERLAEMGRFDEAKAAAVQSVFDPDPPMILQGRAAWVEAKRGNLPVAVREMQALVTLEPHYYWGWQQLAEWHNEMENSEEFWRRPASWSKCGPTAPSPSPCAARRSCRSATVRARTKTCARRRAAPPPTPTPGCCCSIPSSKTRTTRRPGRCWRCCRSTSAAAGSRSCWPGTPSSPPAPATRKGARRRCANSSSRPCDSTWPINTAVAELRNAGYSDMVDRVLRDTIATFGEYHPYILMAWIEGPQGQAAEAWEKLNVMDQVIHAMPNSFQAYDMKAELLTRLGRYDEALRACQPAALADAAPLALRGRAAWVLGTMSRLDEAIAAMKLLLEEDPEYYWGWQQLANWHDATGNHAEYLQAAESLVQLDPNNPASHAYRGEAKLYGGDRRGAKQDFTAAFEIDNAYAFAGLHLIDEQIADGELDAAGATLARLQEHSDGPYIRLRALRLAVKRQDAEACREIFRELALDGDAPVLVVHKMIEALQGGGFRAEIDNWLAELIDEPDATAVVGKLWIEHKAAQNEFDFEAKLPELMERGEIGREAVFAAVEACGRPNQRARLDRLVELYRPTLERDERGWAKVALAYEGVRDLRAGAAWVADWENRSPNEPWMVHPPTLIMRALGRYEEAEAMTRRALALDGDDGSIPDFRVWLAFEEALRGEVDTALAQLRHVEADELGDVVRIQHAMVEALVLVQQTGLKNRKGAFEEARRRVRTAIDDHAPKAKNADLGRSYQRFARRLAEDAGGVGPKLWSLGQKFNPPV